MAEQDLEPAQQREHRERRCAVRARGAQLERVHDLRTRGLVEISRAVRGLAQLGVSDANKQIITGAVIVVAVLLDTLRNRLNTREARLV